MAWKTSSVMDEKLRFVFEYERGEESMRELCRRHGISRESGYVVLRRYREYGLEGLKELDRRRGIILTRRRKRSRGRCWSCARGIWAGARGS